MNNFIINKKFWKNKKVFITGHTGFKGAWLCIFLNFLGAKITGYSLKPQKKSLFNLANISGIILKSYFEDIRNASKLKSAISRSNADIIFHLAAQPLVSESYKNPKNTFDTNILGTINIMEIIKNSKNIRSAIIVTTDKVYDVKKNKIFNETDLLGGSDPYSMSKVCCELICKSYYKSYEKLNKKIIATVRAGNVIGGGDYSKDRIIPDIYRSYSNNSNILLRNPNHVRPWQHVLEPLAGYLILAEKMYKKELTDKVQNWNFGPNLTDCRTVKYVAEKFSKKLSIKLQVQKNKKKIKETYSLRLNNAKSKKYLRWVPKWSIDKCIIKIIEWNTLTKKKNILDVCEKQLIDYLND